MIQNKSLEVDCSKLIATQKYQPDLAQKLVNKTALLTTRYSFIDLSQWILLLFLNGICFGFITLACIWID